VDWNINHELIKGLISGMSGVVLLALTWLVGQRLSYQWSVRQKRRELQLASLQQFYAAYGEFFAVWKLWNRLDGQDAMRAERRWELLKRSAAAEATIEGTSVKLSVELELKTADISCLGRFRQAFQQLRESIRDDVHLPWPDSTCPEYLTFKALSVSVAALLTGKWSDSPVPAATATAQLFRVTSNEWEKKWVLPEYLSKIGPKLPLAKSSKLET
jgi:hypothetical protein